MNKKGITLTEVLVTCCIVAIMGSIAIVNFGSYEDPTQKRELYQSAKVWSARVKTCILNVGGWQIERPGGESQTPCRVGGGPKSHKNKFKKQLGWDCPVEKQPADQYQAGCFGYPDSKSVNEWYCLSIKKEVKGKKYQCIVHFDIKKHREKIYCGTPSNFLSLSSDIKCGNADPAYSNLNEADKNKWPEDSSTTTPPQGDPANNSG